jgi:hypothetical protein
VEYKCRFLTPKALHDRFKVVEADSWQMAALEFHFQSGYHGYAYNHTRKDGGRESIKFARVEVEGYDSTVTRMYYMGISRKGGIKIDMMTLEEIAKAIGYDNDPQTLLDEGWEGESEYELV